MSGSKLPLVEFEPRSMLRGAQTLMDKPRFPVIDFHTHLSWSPLCTHAAPNGGEMVPTAPVRDLIPVMDRRGVKHIVNVTGGYGGCLDQSLETFTNAHPDRFSVFVEPWYQRINEKGYPAWQAGEIEKAHAKGARGVKTLKVLGLFLREGVTEGPLVKVDDRRFDPMWETAGGLKMPILIHVSDPEAFFLPIDRFNERYEELHAHPDWSFHGEFPPSLELHEARNRMIARHPKSTFVLAHFGMAEDLALVSEWLERLPNVYVEFSARIGELGRQPRAARKFFDRFQDRILFGTDAVPLGYEYPQQLYGDLLYQIYYRFLETEDEYFDYAPAAIPPQGRWRISGLGLSDTVLRKVYYENAARLLGLRMEKLRGGSAK